MFNEKKLKMFQSTSEVEVKELITKSLNKSRHLDSLPTWLLKKYVDQVLLLITPCINRSMVGSVIPFCLKTSHRNPVAKEIWRG